MASTRWRSGAAKVAQVTTYAFASTWEADDLIRVVIGAKKHDFTAGNTSVSTIIDNLVAAWVALDSTDFPEFAEITPTRSSTSLVLTSTDAGIPFTATLTPLESDGSASGAQTIEGGTGATTGTTATAATGPYHWNDARNWSGGAVPVNSDDVYIDHVSAPIKYGLDQSGVTLATLTIGMSFEGTDGAGQQSAIGLPEVNTDATAYTEYRDTYLKIGVTSLVLGDGEGQGCGRYRINLGTVQTTALIKDTGTRYEQDVESVQLKGTHASNVLTVLNGDVAVAGYGGDVSTVATLSVGTGERSTANVRMGPGSTLTTVNLYSGAARIQSAVTTLTCKGGALLTEGSGAITTLTLRGGTSADLRSSGTITTMLVDTGAAATFLNDTRAKTVSALDIYGGASLALDRNVISLTNGVDLNDCQLSDVSLFLGFNIRLTLGTPS